LEELPEYLTLGDVLKMFGPQVTPELIERAIALGIGEPVGARFRIPSPRLLRVGAELVAIGMPPAAVLDLFEQIKGDIEQIADRLVRAVVAHVLTDREPGWLPSAEEIPQLAALTQRLRPLPQDALAPMLSRAMEDRMRTALAEWLGSALARPETATPRRTQGRPDHVPGRRHGKRRRPPHRPGPQAGRWLSGDPVGVRGPVIHPRYLTARQRNLGGSPCRCRHRCRARVGEQVRARPRRSTGEGLRTSVRHNSIRRPNTRNRKGKCKLSV
jgi:hypothetical protein